MACLIQTLTYFISCHVLLVPLPDLVLGIRPRYNITVTTFSLYKVSLYNVSLCHVSRPVSRISFPISRVLYHVSRITHSVSHIPCPVSRVLYHVFRFSCPVSHVPFLVYRFSWSLRIASIAFKPSKTSKAFPSHRVTGAVAFQMLSLSLR